MEIHSVCDQSADIAPKHVAVGELSCGSLVRNSRDVTNSQPRRQCDVSGDLTPNDQSEPLGDDSCNGQPDWTQEMTMDDRRQPSLGHASEDYHHHHHPPSDGITTNDQDELLGQNASNGQPDVSQTTDAPLQPPLGNTQDHPEQFEVEDIVANDQGEALCDDTSNGQPDWSREMTMDDQRPPSPSRTAQDHYESSDDVSTNEPGDVRAGDLKESFHDVRADDPKEPLHEDTRAGNQRRLSIGVCSQDAVLAQFWQDYECGDLDRVHSFLEIDELLAQEDRVLQQTVLYHQQHWGL